MKLELTAEFIGKGEVKQIGEHTLTKFYVEADKDTDYPTKVEFQFFNDKIDLSSVNKNDKCTVHFNINSRVWESPDKGKVFFQNLTAWKITTDTPQLPKNDTKKEEDIPFAITMFLAIGSMLSMMG